MVNILYFASVREEVGLHQEQVELPAGVATIGQLRDWLQTRGGGWSRGLSPQQLRMAVDEVICDADEAIGPESRVAFFPPVTGG